MANSNTARMGSKDAKSAQFDALKQRAIEALESIQGLLPYYLDGGKKLKLGKPGQACTNGGDIYLPLDTLLKMKGSAKDRQMALGFFLHEAGHCLFSDFKVQSTTMDWAYRKAQDLVTGLLKELRLHEAARAQKQAHDIPKEIEGIDVRPVKRIADLKAIRTMKLDQSFPGIAAKFMQKLMNCVEDPAIEHFMCNRYGNGTTRELLGRTHEETDNIQPAKLPMAKLAIKSASLADLVCFHVLNFLAASVNHYDGVHYGTTGMMLLEAALSGSAVTPGVGKKLMDRVVEIADRASLSTPGFRADLAKDVAREALGAILKDCICNPEKYGLNKDGKKSKSGKGKDAGNSDPKSSEDSGKDESESKSSKGKDDGKSSKSSQDENGDESGSKSNTDGDEGESCSKSSKDEGRDESKSTTGKEGGKSPESSQDENGDEPKSKSSTDGDEGEPDPAPSNDDGEGESGSSSNEDLDARKVLDGFGAEQERQSHSSSEQLSESELKDLSQALADRQFTPVKKPVLEQAERILGSILGAKDGARLASAKVMEASRTGSHLFDCVPLCHRRPLFQSGGEYASFRDGMKSDIALLSRRLRQELAGFGSRRGGEDSRHGSRVSPSKTARIDSGLMVARPFMGRTVEEAVKTSVFLLIDISQSMEADAIANSLVLLGETFGKVESPALRFGIGAYDDFFTLVKRPGERFTSRLAASFPEKDGSTNGFSAVAEASAVLAKERGFRKILLTVTDGAWQDAGCCGSLKDELGPEGARVLMHPEYLADLGIESYGILLGDWAARCCDPKQYPFHSCIKIPEYEGLAAGLAEMLAKALRQSRTDRRNRASLAARHDAA